MALRFQHGNDDEISRAAREERGTPVLVFLLVLYAVIQGAIAWVRGETLASYEKDLSWCLGFAITYWIFAPFYYELRIREKEIDGKVSAIEQTVTALNGHRAELLERLSTIEEKLNSIRED